jgi:penicillin-binding protein 1C
VTLGNAEVRLDELVAAYAAFARGGEWLEPSWLAERDGPRPAPDRVAADGVLDHRHPLGSRGARVRLRPRRQPRVPVPVAVKTGTSQAYHDNWTIGYTRT